MNRRILTAAMAISLSVFAAQGVFAAPLAPHSPATSDKPVKVKAVSFNVRNDSAMTQTVKAGDQQFTIEPGKSAAVKFPEGTQLTTVNGTSRIAAGSVLTVVTKDLGGNTIVIS